MEYEFDITVYENSQLPTQYVCMAEFAHRVSRGFIYTKESFCAQLNSYNREKQMDIDSGEILYYAIDSGSSLLANQIYPFVIDDLKKEAKELPPTERKQFKNYIYMLQKMYKELKLEDGAIN